ncbi:MAG: type II toxin-antitoxin system HicA family toxin [Methanothrix sp.]|nr:type II toxin-antitoxin system HicA family toxin [Methanothrix sp.]
MSKLIPIPRRELIRRLRKLGFAGPYPGSDHDYMVRDGVYVSIPNPHGSDISVKLLSIILKQGKVSRDEWLSI